MMPARLDIKIQRLKKTVDIVLEHTIQHSWAPESLGNLLAVSQAGHNLPINLLSNSMNITASPLTATPKEELHYQLARICKNCLVSKL